MSKIAIVGVVGVPANYGGFETLAENLLELPAPLTVYCAKSSYAARPRLYRGARLVYLPFKANGFQSIVYDGLSMLHARLTGHRCLLILGVSGAIFLPILKLLSPSTKTVVNIDGIEWRREKFGRLQRWFLRVSEAIAVRYGHTVIADNQGIADYVAEAYGVTPEVIAYGGDHVVTEHADSSEWKNKRYAFGLCRIEPENNVHVVIEACVLAEYPLVFVGNWDANEYGRGLRERYQGAPHITLLDPIYDQEKLAPLRANCSLYIHGHSAGGTNPSLVEMMMFGKPILAFDCVFNRATLDGLGGYFDSVEDLTTLLVQGEANNSGGDIKRLALERYCWSTIRDAYGRALGLEGASND